MNNRKTKFNDKIFNKFTYNSSYLLGLIISDGCISTDCNSANSKLLAFGSVDLDLIKNFIKLMKGDNHISSFKNPKRPTSKTYYNIRFYSKIIYNRLIELGITERKSLTIKWPVIPEKYIDSFIRGLFDGDGCIAIKNNNPSLTFCGTFDIVNNINKIFYQKFGYLGQMNKRKPNLYYLSYYSSYALKTWYKYLYKSSNKYTRLNRKYVKFKELIKIFNKKKSRKAIVHHMKDGSWRLLFEGKLIGFYQSKQEAYTNRKFLVNGKI